ncbi:30471_t:CDS:2 [Gigaspora margarita]|uniref:30471_t:CDS:1 n=1 Tax=Gigaspora margarita TaxID=4874 RepID=A0ABN7UJG6_GIGMA|nr:30471_t:CDS:2 [Gigaspora margarita]
MNQQRSNRENEILTSKGNVKENGYVEKEKPQENVTLEKKRSGKKDDSDLGYKVYGVFPYVVPVLDKKRREKCKEPYTMATDVYSFGEETALL